MFITDGSLDKMHEANVTFLFKDFRYFFETIFLFLTHFSPVSHFYTSWKRQKTFGFLTFSRGIEMWY